MNDHADQSVLEEPTIPPVGHDHPIMDASWAGNLSYEIVDAAFVEWDTARQEFDALCESLNYPCVKAPPTDIQLAIIILRTMERHGLAPDKARFSWNCIESLTITPWIWDRFEQLGLQVDRGEVERRRADGRTP